MPKFDFNNSRYARFFSDKTNQRFLQSFVNTEGLLYTNYGWYKTQGVKAGAPTPTAPNGIATFSVKGRDLKAAPLMDLRAPLGDSNQHPFLSAWRLVYSSVCSHSASGCHSS